MPTLPNNYTITAAAGSEWVTSFTVYNDDGTLADITNKTFEFVVRNRLGRSGIVLFSVTGTASTADGTILIDTATSTIQVVLTPIATAKVVEGGGPYTLWMNPGVGDDTALVAGTFYANVVAAA